MRLRPGLIFKREAASEIRRLFAGPLLPVAAAAPGAHPDRARRMHRLRFQAVHVARRRRGVPPGRRRRDVRGAFNVAADPVLDPAELGRLLGAARSRVPRACCAPRPTRAGELRLQPTPPGWLDMALGVPLMDITRAREELGWTPARSAGEALLELLDGMRRSDGLDTPPLKPAGGPLRVRELLTGIGGRSR